MSTVQRWETEILLLGGGLLAVLLLRNHYQHFYRTTRARVAAGGQRVVQHTGNERGGGGGAGVQYAVHVARLDIVPVSCQPVAVPRALRKTRVEDAAMADELLRDCEPGTLMLYLPGGRYAHYVHPDYLDTVELRAGGGKWVVKKRI